ncbi:MAG: hypothetical protein ACPGYT_14915 [Nitrospirales bacterium]
MLTRLILISLIFVWSGVTTVFAEGSTFTATTTDASGVEMTLSNARLYWEDKIDETTFVPHEITYVPVKRGAATMNVKFENIKQIQVKSNHPKKGNAALSIALQNGKSGEFPLARAVSLVGDSDFGEIKVPVQDLRKIVLTANGQQARVQAQSKTK